MTSSRVLQAAAATVIPLTLNMLLYGSGLLLHFQFKSSCPVCNHPLGYVASNDPVCALMKKTCCFHRLRFGEAVLNQLPILHTASCAL